jgi:hypothetical protein
MFVYQSLLTVSTQLGLPSTVGRSSFGIDDQLLFNWVKQTAGMDNSKQTQWDNFSFGFHREEYIVNSSLAFL